MNKILYSILLTLCCVSTFAQRSEADMMSIAASRLQAAGVKATFGNDKTPAVRCLQQTKEYNIYGSTVADGFVIVAKNENVQPVLAYGDTRLDVERMPTDMQWCLSLMERRLAKSDQAPIARRAAKFSPVANFITTKWGQGSPYNLLTPTVDGEHCPVGCVATALAQCMNVFKYPASASFESDYKVKGADKTATVNSTYTWNYSDSYGSSSLIAGKRIGQLMVDCGYATCMSYEKDGSGTYNYLSGAALVNHFKYPEQCVKYLDRFNISDDEWYDIIYSEIQNGSPILYGGSDPKNGGHAFVLSGIDADGLVYVNWGWNGEANGFFAIDILDSPMGSFTEGQDMTFGIRTEPLPTDYVHGWITTLNDSVGYAFRYEPYVNEEQGYNVQKCIQIDIPRGFANFNSSSFIGDLGLFAIDLTDDSEWVVAETDRDTIGSGYGVWGDSIIYFYDVADLKVGHTYRMSFGARDDRDTRWRSLLCLGGEIAYDVTIGADGNATITGPVEVPIVAGNTSAVRSLAATKDDGLTRVYDLSGRQVYVAPTRSFNLWEVPARGVLVVSDANGSRRIVR